MGWGSGTRVQHLHSLQPRASLFVYHQTLIVSSTSPVSCATTLAGRSGVDTVSTSSSMQLRAMKSLRQSHQAPNVRLVTAPCSRGKGTAEHPGTVWAGGCAGTRVHGACRVYLLRLCISVMCVAMPMSCSCVCPAVGHCPQQLAVEACAWCVLCVGVHVHCRPPEQERQGTVPAGRGHEQHRQALIRQGTEAGGPFGAPESGGGGSLCLVQ